MNQNVRNWAALHLLIVITVVMISVNGVCDQQINDPKGTEQKTGNQQASEQKASDHKTYRLVRVTIPPDSPHRKDLSGTPKPYVIILKNGTQVGKASSAGVGWEVEFPDESRNRWDISSDTSSSYTLQLWDSRWGKDVLIFSKTKLNAAAFDAPIKEALGSGYIEANAASVEFAEVPSPTGK